MKIADPNGSPSALSQRESIVKIMPAIADDPAVSRARIAPIPDSVSVSGDNARLPVLEMSNTTLSTVPLLQV